MNIKINNKFLLSNLVLLFFSISSLKSQEKLSFTKEQLHQDYKFLTQIIENVYAKQFAYDTITNRSLKSEFKGLEKKINLINSNGEFVNLVQTTLNLTSDTHSTVVSGQDLPNIINWLPENEKKGLLKFVDTSRIKESRNMIREYYKYRSQLVDSFQFYLYSNYFDGEYYNLIPFEKNGVYVETGIKIVEIDGINIHKWVNNHLNDYSFINYDKKNNCYYANLFFSAVSFFKDKKTVNLSFQNSSNEIFSIKFDLNKRPNFIKERKLSINLAKVKFFRQDKTLYIRLSSMSDLEEYLKKIKKYSSNNDVQRIIIDIRGNYGGSDLVWKKIIEALIDKPLVVNLNVLAKKTKMVKEYLNLNEEKKTIFKNEEFLKLDMNELETYNPSSNSLKFSKKIIVLQDKNIYSSAGSFSSIASYSEKFITIGTSADKIIGVGITPMYFMLPNTGILIQIDPTIDVTNADKFFDLFNSVEIPVKQTIESIYIWQKKNGNRWKHKFLSKHDPFYQKAIEIDIN